jgi:SAM-dependent methyltransferase
MLVNCARQEKGPSMMIAEFSDPRLVAIYDIVNAYTGDSQPRFYSQLAAEIGAKSIVDLGCGTGLITCELAKQGYKLIGIDPAPAMIEMARRRECAGRVRWIVGDAGHIGESDAHLAIMTGHVAQFFLTDESWRAALVALHHALRPGGRLSFESRNPSVREWESWTRNAKKSVNDPTVGWIETWSELQGVQDGIVSYAIHYLFVNTGEVLVAPSKLRFRTKDELTTSLASAGFAVEHIYGDWDRRPAGARSSELIVVATR